MIYLIGGDGYVGRHVQKALYDIHAEYSVIDPGAGTGTSAVVAPKPTDWTVWLAGPRNNGPERQQAALAAMVEHEWYEFLRRASGCRVLFLSSMSIFDDMDSSYKRHKQKMDAIFRTRELTLDRALSLWPGTVIGTMPGVMTVRADTCANAVASALAQAPVARINLATTRCFVTIETLVAAIMSALNHGRVERTPTIYETIAPLSQVIPPELIKLHAPEFFSEPTPCPASPFWLTPPTLRPDLLPRLQDAVRLVYEHEHEIKRI